MSIAPKEFVSYINGRALTEWCRLSKPCRDERVNVRPNNMPHTNSPFAILTHCVGLTRYFIGTARLGARCTVTATRIPRPWDSRGDPAGGAQLQQHLADDLARVHGDQPCAFPEAVREPHRTWTQGRLCSSVTKNWRNTMGTWNSRGMSCWDRDQPARESAGTDVGSVCQQNPRRGGEPHALFRVPTILSHEEEPTFVRLAAGTWEGETTWICSTIWPSSPRAPTSWKSKNLPLRS